MSSDSSSFTSLLDLVESHLSKTSLEASPSGENNGVCFALPNLSGISRGLSDTLLTPPNKVVPLPRLGLRGKTDITDVLAHQVTNMLIAKEKKKKEEEEKQRAAEEMRLLKLKEEEENYVIDLMPAIISQDDEPVTPLLKSVPPTLSNSSSFESLFSEVNKEPSSKETLPKKVVEILPITRDMSYILLKKIKKGKASAFGKVISSRLRPVAAPYLKTEIINPAVVRFDFSTKSPCDIIKERRLHPPPDPFAHMNMVDRFMALTNREPHNIFET